LVEAMIGRYKSKWFNQISFDQTTSFYKDGKVVKTESWQEIYKYPSKLLISYDKTGSGSGQLYRNDSVYFFENYQIVSSRRIIHDLLVLSMDIYHYTPEQAMSRIKNMGYNDKKFYTTTFNDRPVYVVGAENEKDFSNQFWIDKEHLYFVKMIKQTEYGLQEVEFNNYIEIDNNGWIEQEVVFKIDGEIYLIEKYYNIRIPDNEPDEKMFSPDAFSSEEVLQSIIRFIDIPSIEIIDLNRRILVSVFSCF
jgi:hypothetical protein